MKITFSLRMAFRTLGNSARGKKNGSVRLRTSVLAVGLSLIPLVMVFEVADGMIEGITRRFIELGTYHLQVFNFAAGSPEDEERLARRIAGLEGVKLAVRERQGVAIASSPQGQTGVSVRALETDIWKKDEDFRRYLKMEEGVFDLSDPSSILLGREAAERLNASAGDQIRLLTLRSVPGGSFLPRVSRFEVMGIFSTGYQDLDKLWVFVPLDQGYRLFPGEDGRQILGVKLKSTYGEGGRLWDSGLSFSSPTSRISVAAERVSEILPSNWYLRTWFEAEKSRYMSFRTTKNLLVFVMSLIVCVAAINIASSLLMMAIQRREEIAILKSLGASPGQINLSFVIIGFIIGLAGAFLGISIGLLAAVHVNEIMLGMEAVINGFRKLISPIISSLLGQESADFTVMNPDFYLNRIPIIIELPQLMIAGGLTVLLSSLAALIPARKAASIRPMEVLRRH